MTLSSYSLHAIDSGRVLVAIGLTLTPALRDRILDATDAPMRITSEVVGGRHGDGLIPAIRIECCPRLDVADARIPERDAIEIRSLLAAHAAEPIT